MKTETLKVRLEGRGSKPTEYELNVPETIQEWINQYNESFVMDMIRGHGYAVVTQNKIRALVDKGLSIDEAIEHTQNWFRDGCPRESGGRSIKEAVENASKKAQIDMVHRTLTGVGFSESEINQLIELHGLENVLAVVFGSGLKPGDADTDDDVDNEDEEADA
jgi:hypothetical protein